MDEGNGASARASERQLQETQEQGYLDRRKSQDSTEHTRNDNIAAAMHQSEGDRNDGNIELTEVALPAPESPQRLDCKDGLENQEREAEKSIERGRSTEDAEVTEIMAPEPIDGSLHSFDKETAANSPTKVESLEEQQEETEKDQALRKPSSLATEIYIISWLVFFSFWGTLARLGVEAITLYPSTPFPSRVLWANLGGSFIMGFLIEDRRLFFQEWGSPDPKAPAANHGKVKKTIPLFIGLSTGFCGCFTSFSSFIRDSFLALTNDLQSSSSTSPYRSDSRVGSRNGGFSFLALLAILIVHPAVAMGGFLAGAQFALLLQPVLPSLSFRLTRKVLDPAIVVIGFGCWLGTVFLAIFPPGNADHWRSRAVFPLVFSPPGCVLRFYLSKHLNARIPSFPLGTFAANCFGTAILGMAWDLQHTKSIGGHGGMNRSSCAVLQGIMEGFCGCLTTVSTWVAEIHGLRRSHGWRYGLTSAGVSLGIMVIIMGSMGWTIGFHAPVCG